MGLMLSIVSRFRKRATTKEVLEGIEEDINKLESTLQRNQHLQKKIVLSLLSFSFLGYGIAIGIFYFFLLPDDWSDRAIWILPFLCFPVLVYLLKKAFHFFFVTRIKKIGKALEELNKRKKEILDDVTENETYKVAKELLEKYDPHGKIIEREFAIKPEKSPSGNGALRQRLSASSPQPGNQNQIIRSPNNTTPAPTMIVGQFRPVGPNMSPRMPSPGNVNANGNPRPAIPRGFPQQRPNLQRFPFVSGDRSLFDKMAEYFIGDGPSYRYALICKTCHGHNGMALKDEFEYTAFRCCYCGQENSARKERPNAPPLEQGSVLLNRASDEELQEDQNESKDKEERNEDDLIHLNESEESDEAENGKITKSENEKKTETAEGSQEENDDTKMTPS